jgi:putative FmdB family regulatory protein
MPIYDFICNECGNKFDKFLPISERESPIKEPCSKCGLKKIIRNYDNQIVSLTSDMLVTPNSKTGGDWNELMNRMKKGLPKSAHANLDRASDRSLRKWQQ